MSIFLTILYTFVFMTSLKRIALLFTISLLISSCDSSKSSHTSILDFIDPSWSLIYTIDEISQVEKDLQDNVLIDQMSTTRLQQVLKKYPFIGKLPYSSEIAIALPGVEDTTNNVLVIAKFQKARAQDSLQKTNTPTKGIVLSQVCSERFYLSSTTWRLLFYILGVKKWLEKAQKSRKKSGSSPSQTNGFKHV